MTLRIAANTQSAVTIDLSQEPPRVTVIEYNNIDDSGRRLASEPGCAQSPESLPPLEDIELLASEPPAAWLADRAWVDYDR